MNTAGKFHVLGVGNFEVLSRAFNELHLFMNRLNERRVVGGDESALGSSLEGLGCDIITDNLRCLRDPNAAANRRKIYESSVIDHLYGVGSLETEQTCTILLGCFETVVELTVSDKGIDAQRCQQILYPACLLSSLLRNRPFPSLKQF